VIAHSDWYCGDLRFADVELSAAYDSDSLTAHTESVLAGVAGAHTDGSTNGAPAPTPQEVAAFLAYDDDQPDRPFTAAEQTAAVAAATWVMAYNARCQLHRLGLPAEDGRPQGRLRAWLPDRTASNGCEPRRAPTGACGQERSRSSEHFAVGVRHRWIAAAASRP
jgi:hypothetical protein